MPSPDTRFGGLREGRRKRRGREEEEEKEEREDLVSLHYFMKFQI